MTDEDRKTISVECLSPKHQIFYVAIGGQMVVSWGAGGTPWFVKHFGYEAALPLLIDFVSEAGVPGKEYLMMRLLEDS